MKNFFLNLRAELLSAAVCLLILSSYTFAKAQDDVYKVVAQSSCDCISKQDLANKSKKEIEAALGICMLEAINKNKVDINISDQDAMTTFGEKVGLQMAPICPSVFKVFMDSDDSETSVTIEGKIKSIEINDFLYVIVKEDGSNEHRVIWLSNFGGSDSFVSDPKKLIGKNVSLKYRTGEFYSPKAKGYLSLKEIVELKIKE